MKCMAISASPCEPCNRDAPLLLEESRVWLFDLQLFADGDKTEEPTAKKRADARKKGQVGKSQELNTAFVLLMGFFMLKLLWDSIYMDIADYTKYILSHPTQTVDTETVIQLFLGIVELLAKTSFPIMIAIMFIGLSINFYQVGLHFNTESMEPKLSKLNPINGFGRIFSKRALVELLKSIFKIIVIGSALYMVLIDHVMSSPQFIFLDWRPAWDRLRILSSIWPSRFVGSSWCWACLTLLIRNGRPPRTSR